MTRIKKICKYSIQFLSLTLVVIPTFLMPAEAQNFNGPGFGGGGASSGGFGSGVSIGGGVGSFGVEDLPAARKIIAGDTYKQTITSSPNGVDLGAMPRVDNCSEDAPDYEFCKNRSNGTGGIGGGSVLGGVANGFASGALGSLTKSAVSSANIDFLGSITSTFDNKMFTGQTSKASFSKSVQQLTAQGSVEPILNQSVGVASGISTSNDQNAAMFLNSLTGTSKELMQSCINRKLSSGSFFGGSDPKTIPSVIPQCNKEVMSKLSALSSALGNAVGSKIGGLVGFSSNVSNNKVAQAGGLGFQQMFNTGTGGTPTNTGSGNSGSGSGGTGIPGLGGGGIRIPGLGVSDIASILTNGGGIEKKDIFNSFDSNPDAASQVGLPKAQGCGDGINYGEEIVAPKIVATGLYSKEEVEAFFGPNRIINSRPICLSVGNSSQSSDIVGGVRSGFNSFLGTQPPNGGGTITHTPGRVTDNGATTGRTMNENPGSTTEIEVTKGAPPSETSGAKTTRQKWAELTIKTYERILRQLHNSCEKWKNSESMIPSDLNVAQNRGSLGKTTPAFPWRYNSSYNTEEEIELRGKFLGVVDAYCSTQTFECPWEEMWQLVHYKGDRETGLKSSQDLDCNALKYENGNQWESGLLLDARKSPKMFIYNDIAGQKITRPYLKGIKGIAVMATNSVFQNLITKKRDMINSAYYLVAAGLNPKAADYDKKIGKLNQVSFAQNALIQADLEEFNMIPQVNAGFTKEISKQIKEAQRERMKDLGLVEDKFGSNLTAKFDQSKGGTN